MKRAKIQSIIKGLIIITLISSSAFAVNTADRHQALRVKHEYTYETINGYEVVRGERPPIDLESVPADAYYAGKLYVKFKPALAEAIPDKVIAANGDGVARTGVPLIDAVNVEAGATQLRPLFESLYFNGRSQHPHRERHKAWGFHLWFEIKVDAQSDIMELVQKYRSLNEVEWAEPVYKKVHTNDFEKPVMLEIQEPEYRGMDWVPDDPMFGDQWHYHNTGQGGGTVGKDISLVAAWGIEKGHEDVIVAIIDSGVQFDHPDLAANMWQNDDGDYGYNWWNNSITIQPGNHGTHVAGTVAAVSNNMTGVSGIAGGDGSGNGVRLMSLQVFSADDQYSGGFHLASVYAADNGAAISQNSWGHNNPNTYNQAVLDAIDYFNINGGGAVLSGGITIFAAGNSNQSQPRYPAAYSGALAVAATQNTDAKASYSDYGNWIDISAPGGQCEAVVGVLSTLTGDAYGYSCGTSMACPHVSGVAALLVSNAHRNNFMLSAEDVWDLLIDNSDDHYPENPAYTGLLGSGRLNAESALSGLWDLMFLPTLFNANAVSSSEIELSWHKNIHDHDVMVVWNTDNVFGEPVNGSFYTAGELIPGGGTVLYSGGGLSVNHINLDEGTMYFYRSYSIDLLGTYYGSRPAQAGTHINTIPFRETFEDNSSSRGLWTQENVSGSGEWVFDSGWGDGSTAYKGLLNARLGLGGEGLPTRKLVSPVLNLSAIDNPQVVFFHAQASDGFPPFTGNYQLKVYYRTAPDQVWNQLEHYTSSTLWVERVIDLPNPSTTYQVAFEGIIPQVTGYPVAVDEVRFRKTPTCNRVANLQWLALGPQSATLDWDVGGGENLWDIKYGDIGFDPELDGTLVAGIDQKPYVLSGLQSGTYYEAYVRAACNPDDLSEWNLTPLKFATGCINTVDLPFTENFNDVALPLLPLCWESRVSSTDPNASVASFGAAFPNSPPYHIRMRNGDDPDATLILISPSTSSPLSNLELKFWLKGLNGYTLDVGVYAVDRNEFELVETINMSNNAYVQHTISFAGYEGDATKIAFRHGLGGTSRNIYIDDVTIDHIPVACPSPINLAVSEISYTSAQLNWQAGGGETTWSLVYGTPGFDPASEGTLIEGISDNPYTLNPPLVHNTSYEVYVKAICDEFEESDWAGPVAFQTLQVTYPITFSLDMATADPWFNHNTEEVFISGGFPGADWDEPGTNNDMKLTRINPSSWLYTVTLDLPAGSYEYKYYRNAGWAGGEWAGGDNRSIEVNAQATQNDVWGGELAWANLQHPANGAITAGDNFNVYAQAFIPNNKTGNADPANGMFVWIGAHTENTDPATWPDGSWGGAFYNQAVGNNDEYVADLGFQFQMDFVGGTYYYASRFQLGTGDYMYGGYNAGGGGFWDGTANVSGVLEVEGLPVMTWLGSIDNDWGNAGNWEDNDLPLLDTDDVLIATVVNQPLIQNHVEVNNLTIQPGNVLSIAPTGSLTAWGDITNNAGPEGLVLQSSAAGTGSLMNDMGWNIEATVQRYVTGNENLEAGAYHQVSVPLANWPEPTAALFTGAYLFRFNPETQNWQGLGPNPDTPLNNESGYLIYYPGESTTFNFAGNLNNGNFMPNVQYHEANETSGWNLVPNPYPSAIDWDAEFGWEKNNMNAAIYIWNNGQYASYVAGEGTNGGTNIIATGQSFFIRVNEFPFFQMDNQVRVHGATPFLKKQVAKNLLRVKALANGKQDEIVLRFQFDAGHGFDSKYDAFKLENDAPYPHIATLTPQGEELSINSLPFANEVNVVDLVYRHTVAGQVQFEFENLESFASGSLLYLEDLATNQTINLHLQGHYLFAYHPEEQPGRFKLHFGNITGLEKSPSETHHRIWVNEAKLYVHIPGMDGQSATVSLYDATGREVYSSAMVLGSPVVLRHDINGIVVVRARTAAQVYTSKIFIR